jgi:diguanylate cyclase (GGDEF)-like protein
MQLRKPGAPPAPESGERVNAKVDSAVRPRSLDAEIPRLSEDEDITEVSKSTRLMPAARSFRRPRLTVMTGVRAGAVLRLDHKHQFFLGRSVKADLHIDDHGVSRIHCRIARKGDEIRIEDLGSTNGTRVNGEIVANAALHAGDRVQLGPLVVLQLGFFDDAEESLQQRLFEASTRDPLTGACNRRFFYQRLEGEVSYARRHGTPLAVLMLEVDRFKDVNDAVGHEGGDVVLRGVAAELARTVRTEDVLARHGGVEFAILARVASADEARRFAERMRMRIENMRTVVAGSVQRVTVSVGVADLGEIDAAAPMDALVEQADRRLYQAKLLGRNRVCGG